MTQPEIKPRSPGPLAKKVIEILMILSKKKVKNTYIDRGTLTKMFTVGNPSSNPGQGFLLIIQHESLSLPQRNYDEIVG